VTAAPIVVIGGGFVGLCSALQLQRRGFAVALVDPGDPERAASFGNAGQFAVGEVVPISGPGTLRRVPAWLADPLGPLAIRWRHLPRLTPWLIRFLRAGRADRVAAISAAMAKLCDLIHLDYHPLLEAAGAGSLVRPGPHLRLYPSRAEFDAEGWRWELRVRSGLRHELLDRPALHALEPTIGESIGFAVASPDRSSVLEPLALMSAFGSCLRAGGGEVVQASATGFRREGSRVTGVTLADGAVLPASQVVIAAGAWSHRLTALLGDRVPLESERGYHVVLPEPGVVPRHSMSHVARGFALLPMGDRLRLAGTVELASLDAPPNWDRARVLIEVARDLLPGLNAEGARFWMGHRPALPDSLPIIDRASQAANVIYAFGHGHMGLSWAATTGRLVADLATGTPSNLDTSPFRLARFSGPVWA
jgi:D-amino-acid dehydrogenase